MVLPFTLSEVTTDVSGRRARVLFRVEGEARSEGGVHVGYVGGEQARFTLGSSGWEPEDGVYLPRLAGVLSALSRPPSVVLAGAATNPGAVVAASAPARPRAFLVRITGDAATVSEIDAAAAPTGGGPPGTTTRRLSLTKGAGGWRLSPDSM